jgi:predicted dehydrogenase
MLKKMNIGLIGAGYWGKNLYRNLLISQVVKKIFVLDKKNINIKQNEKTLFFSEQQKFFKNKNIDAFVIATPTSTHFKFISKCLELDKPVCVTKPVTLNYVELLKLKKKYKNINKIFLDHTYLFHSSINYIKKLILKKKLGKLIYYDSERISFGKFYKDVDVIDDLAIHDLYILDYFLNGEMPNSIKINSHNIFGNKNFISNISLKYQSGFFANIKVSWYSPIKSRRILLAGNRKIIEFDDNESDKKIRIYNKGIEYNPSKKVNQWLYRTGSIEIPSIEHRESLFVMINKFFKFVKKKNRSLNTLNHGLRVMKVLSKIKHQV